MRVIDLDKLPQYEGAVIPKDGFGIYGERANVVKLEDLQAIEDRCCFNCKERSGYIVQGVCKCKRHGTAMTTKDFCTRWKSRYGDD